VKFARFLDDGRIGLAAAEPDDHQFRGGLLADLGDPGGSTDVDDLLGRGPDALSALGRDLLGRPEVRLDEVELLPPLARPGKIICIGLNYADHSAEAGFTPPDYPTVFSRFTSSLIGHGDPIIRPTVSDQLDFEGEIAVVLGRGGRNIERSAALDHVAGYTLFNDASLRDYQLKSPQWTMGKNFDSTGAFGPYLVTADELPPGARGLQLETLLNGDVVQSASTDDMVFDVETLIVLLSEVMTLDPGDVIVSGTPAGVGMARTPPLWMRDGDIVTVRATGLGELVNPVCDALPSSSSSPALAGKD